jgi:hypothetical protein
VASLMLLNNEERYHLKSGSSFIYSSPASHSLEDGRKVSVFVDDESLCSPDY